MQLLRGGCEMGARPALRSRSFPFVKKYESHERASAPVYSGPSGMSELTPQPLGKAGTTRTAGSSERFSYLFDNRLTYMDLPPEILILLKTSPWIIVALVAISRLGILLSPFASILAIRLARNDKERSAFLEYRRIERRPPIRWLGRKRDAGKEEE